MAKHYAAYFHADVLDGRVQRCTGTTKYADTAEAARDAGEKDGRPFVVADQHGATVTV